MEVMLDIETLASSHDAVVLSIGAVKFTPFGIGETFYHVLATPAQQKRGRVIDGRTVKWWAQQGPEAQRAALLTEPTFEDVAQSLHAFNRFYEGCTGLWGNGVDFDNVIMRSLFESFEVYPSWSFRDNRCYRTMARLFPAPFIREGVHHNALDDAITQAKALIACAGYQLAAHLAAGKGRKA